MSLKVFHPVVARWFEKKYGEATEPQKQAWPAIVQGRDTLIAAPTGSGKTFAAFLVAIDQLARKAVRGDLKTECMVLYISPLKALANDIRKNLEVPLDEIQDAFAREGIDIPRLISSVRTGDTPASERQKISKVPPHILVTTPESLYLMLTNEKGRSILSTVETVIVDEIHALARDKRGSHLSLSLERLKALTRSMPNLIGLSATQKPVQEIAAFLLGTERACKKNYFLVDVGHSRALELGLLVPPSPLSTVASNEQWEEIYQRLSAEMGNHRSTLIFVNTRRLAERVAYRLNEILKTSSSAEPQVLCHHGSLSKDKRLDAEERLKTGQLKAIVATASLELGIDIGFIDLVCQVGVPYSIATFLQRIGRSGHSIGATPKGLLVPLTRDELIESLALIKSVREGKLDRITIPEAPLDILAQQLIAECAGLGPQSEWPVDEAWKLFTGAWPYRHLSRQEFLSVVRMAADGYVSGRRRSAYLIWDRLRDRLTVRSGARLVATTSGGAIPEMGDYRVLLEDGTVVGSVNEDFAIESLAGDIFLLGTHSWRIQQVRRGDVLVTDAGGQPPTVPFWLGEAPGRSKEFSREVSNLRVEVGERCATLTNEHSEAVSWLGQVTGLENHSALEQAAHYIAVEKAALGLVPSQENVVFERFFDETGGMQLVIHSPYGARINRAWGLALRKRFCRTFDFELQASADDDGIVLSLGPHQSFAIESLFRMVTEQNSESLLVQALLAAPMFAARWRWNATRALAVLRQFGGRRVAPALQRFRAEDLLTAVFPAQTACQENAPGDIEVPDHPLVRQTVHDCLTEAMDLDGLKSVLRRIQSGEINLIAKETREPSPFAYQLLNAYPYAFLDDAPLEERRARTVAMRPALSSQDLQDLDRMDPAAIREVSSEAWPSPKTANELYEVLVSAVALPMAHAADFLPLVEPLIAEGRVAIAEGKNDGRPFRYLVAGESVPTLEAAYNSIQWQQRPPAASASFDSTPPSREEARQAILKGWLEIRGPTAVAELSELFALGNPEPYLAALESTGAILPCRLALSAQGHTHWCARGLLRRIHRLTIEGLREQIRPVEARDYLEMIFEEHGLLLGRETSKPPFTGAEGLAAIIAKLQGFEAPAFAWERELFAGRMEGYKNDYIDELSANGRVAFGRLSPRKVLAGPARVTSLVPLTFARRKDWVWMVLQADAESTEIPLSSNAHAVLEALEQGGAQFIDELEACCRLLESQVVTALGELVSVGLVRCDHFRAFRSVLPQGKRRRGRRAGHSVEAMAAGRWSVLRRPKLERWEERTEKWAAQLLARYGLVFRDLLEREALAPSWGELVRVYRRMEARGEIRGGLFVKGVSGEQFAHASIHKKLMSIRQECAEGQRRRTYAVISSSDPLNLVGIVTKDAKIASSPSTRILFESGVVAGVCRGNELELFRQVEPEKVRALRLIGAYRRQVHHEVSDKNIKDSEKVGRFCGIKLETP